MGVLPLFTGMMVAWESQEASHGKSFPGLHNRNSGQQVKRGDASCLPCSGENSPTVLHPERHGPVRASWEVPLHGAFYKKGRERIFTTGGNCFKLKESRGRLVMKKTFFTIRVVRHWNRFPRVVVYAPLLKVLRSQVGPGFGNLF